MSVYLNVGYTCRGGYAYTVNVPGRAPFAVLAILSEFVYYFFSSLSNRLAIFERHQTTVALSDTPYPFECFSQPLSGA